MAPDHGRNAAVRRPCFFLRHAHVVSRLLPPRQVQRGSGRRLYADGFIVGNTGEAVEPLGAHNDLESTGDSRRPFQVAVPCSEHVTRRSGRCSEENNRSVLRIL